MTTVMDIYTALAVRINYPLKPTYRCLSKIIGHINLLLSLSSTPQVVAEVPLKGESGKRFTDKSTDVVAYLKSGKPCKLNPDGTINTKETSAYVIRRALFQDIETGSEKRFVDSETDVLVDDRYLQPILTSLFLVIQGVSPAEAVMYINEACSKSEATSDLKRINLDNVRRRI